MIIRLGIGDYDIPKTVREGKGKSSVLLPNTYCVLDTETTGLSPEWDEIIEIGAIKYSNNREIGRFQSLVQPSPYDDGTFIDEFIADLTGITNEMLENAPSAAEVIPAFADFLGEDIIIGYNVGFDINFLYDAFEKHLNSPLSNDYVDIMRFSRKLFPELPHHRLKDMVRLFNIQTTREHRAIADVEATEACYCALKEEAIRQYETECNFVDAFKKKYKGTGVRAEDIIGDESKNNPDSPLYKKNCVFTGKLERFTRQQAMQIVANLGGINEDSITKNTNFLILGNNDYCKTIKDGKSNKQKKAESYKLKGFDIEILPENVFYDLIGEE